MSSNTNPFKVEDNRLVFYNLISIIYCTFIFIYLDYYNYFKDSSDLLNESTDFKVVNFILCITLVQECLLMLILNPFGTKSSNLNAFKCAVRSALIFVLSIFTSTILIIFLGATDLR